MRRNYTEIETINLQLCRIPVVVYEAGFDPYHILPPSLTCYLNQKNFRISFKREYTKKGRQIKTELN